jgi:hypothetical protein
VNEIEDQLKEILGKVMHITGSGQYPVEVQTEAIKLLDETLDKVLELSSPEMTNRLTVEEYRKRMVDD